ncbi:unnamed protein product [Lepidochelys kempii]
MKEHIVYTNAQEVGRANRSPAPPAFAHPHRDQPQWMSLCSAKYILGQWFSKPNHCSRLPAPLLAARSLSLTGGTGHVMLPVPGYAEDYRGSLSGNAILHRPLLQGPAY